MLAALAAGLCLAPAAQAGPVSADGCTGQVTYGAPSAAFPGQLTLRFSCDFQVGVVEGFTNNRATVRRAFGYSCTDDSSQGPNDRFLCGTFSGRSTASFNLSSTDPCGERGARFEVDRLYLRESLSGQARTALLRDIRVQGCKDDGGGQPCTIRGTEGNDIIRATPADDVICAGAGNDIVYGGGGNDIIYGAAGNDILRGETGDDRLFGHAGRDILQSRDEVSGNDLADGGLDIDTCHVDQGDEQRSCE